MPAEQLTGGCLCGKVRYELSAGAEPLYSVICHCLNCKKATGGHMLNASLFLKKAFTLTAGRPKTFEDNATDSREPLYRNFCGDCGSPVYLTTPMVDTIVSIPSGTLDEGTTWWRPNKEQYIETKSHWLPDFPVTAKEGVVERHERGPLKEQWSTQPL